MFVYKVTNKINGKIYIGQTIHSLNRRWSQHCGKNSCCRLLYKSIKKYGRENFTIEEIDGANSQSELNYKEWLLIYKFNSLSPNGYNLIEGGSSGKPFLNKIHTKDTKVKMSKSAGSKPFKVFKAKTDEYIGTWINKRQCVRELGLDHSNMAKCFRKNNNVTCKGYKFSYIGG